MVEVLGCGVNVEAPMGNAMESGLDEVKGVLATVVGTIWQVLSYIWGVIMSFMTRMMDDPWKLAHISVTAAILYS